MYKMFRYVLKKINRDFDLFIYFIYNSLNYYIDFDTFT